MSQQPNKTKFSWKPWWKWASKDDVCFQGPFMRGTGCLRCLRLCGSLWWTAGSPLSLLLLEVRNYKSPTKLLSQSVTWWVETRVSPVKLAYVSTINKSNEKTKTRLLSRTLVLTFILTQSHILSWCRKQSLQHQMCIHPLLKIIPRQTQCLRLFEQCLLFREENRL